MVNFAFRISLQRKWLLCDFSWNAFRVRELFWPYIIAAKPRLLLCPSASPFLSQCLARNTRFVLARGFIKRKRNSHPSVVNFEKRRTYRRPTWTASRNATLPLRNFYQALSRRNFFPPSQTILRVFRSCTTLLKLSSDRYEAAQTRSLRVNK